MPTRDSQVFMDFGLRCLSLAAFSFWIVFGVAVWRRITNEHFSMRWSSAFCPKLSSKFSEAYLSNLARAPLHLWPQSLKCLCCRLSSAQLAATSELIEDTCSCSDHGIHKVYKQAHFSFQHCDPCVVSSRDFFSQLAVSFWQARAYPCLNMELKESHLHWHRKRFEPLETSFVKEESKKAMPIEINLPISEHSHVSTWQASSIRNFGSTACDLVSIPERRRRDICNIQTLSISADPSPFSRGRRKEGRRRHVGLHLYVRGEAVVFDCFLS